MPTIFTGPVISVGQDLLTDSSTQYHNLGAYVETNDGRGFRYCLVGATSLVVGKMYQTAAEDTTNLNPSGGLAVAAAAIGATTVTLTGSLTIAANLVAGGYLAIDAGTPSGALGYIYRIKSNTAVAGAANCAVTLDDPIVIALTTSSKAILTQHPYANVVVTPSTLTGPAVGVATHIITNANYGWLQTYGMTAVLVDASAPGAGQAVNTSDDTGGSLGIIETDALVHSLVGNSRGTSVSAEYNFVYLTIH